MAGNKELAAQRRARLKSAGLRVGRAGQRQVKRYRDRQTGGKGRASSDRPAGKVKATGNGRVRETEQGRPRSKNRGASVATPTNESEFSAACTAFQKKIGRLTEALDARDWLTLSRQISQWAESLAADTNMDKKVVIAAMQLSDDVVEQGRKIQRLASGIEDVAGGSRNVWKTYLKRYSGTREDAGRGVRNLTPKNWFDN